jgi:hypothetical protein
MTALRNHHLEHAHEVHSLYSEVQCLGGRSVTILDPAKNTKRS